MGEEADTFRNAISKNPLADGRAATPGTLTSWRVGSGRISGRRGAGRIAPGQRAPRALWPVPQNADEKADPRLDWLRPRAGPRLTILAELGRLLRPEAIRTAAALICEHRWSTRVALERLRRIRLGRKVDHVKGLATAISAAIRAYQRTHGRVPPQAALDALHGVVGVVDAALGVAPPRKARRKGHAPI